MIFSTLGIRTSVFTKLAGLLAQTLPLFICVITFFDIVIIYLACGTPFGVYFYVQNRQQKSLTSLFLGSFLRTLLWIPFGITYFHSRITKKLPIFKFDNKSTVDSLLALEIENIKKSLESHLLEARSTISLFDLREVLDRYCGLTLELKEPCENFQNHDDLEIFALSRHPNSTLGSLCMQRRNLIHLKRHQTLAGEDLLNVFDGLDISAEKQEDIRESLLRLTVLLDDKELETSLRGLYHSQPQIDHYLPVNELEKEVWISKQQPSKQATTTLKAISATASLSKD